MKKFAALLLALLLLAASAQAETVQCTVFGYLDLPFSNGYIGMDLAQAGRTPYKGESFTVLGTDQIMSDDGQPIGNKLKILLTQYFNELSSAEMRAAYSWHFSNDHDIPAYLDQQILDEIEASDLVIPDHGYHAKVSENMAVTFDFCYLKNNRSSSQNTSYFGFKLTFDVLAEGQRNLSFGPWGDQFYDIQWQALVDGKWQDLPLQTYPTLNTSAFEVGSQFRLTWKGTDDGFVYRLRGLPEITSPTEEQVVTVKENENVVLCVTAKEADHYEWQFFDNGQWLGMDPSDMAEFDMGIADLSQDGALYRCRAWNDFGEDYSPVFKLNVLPAPPAVPATGDAAPLTLYAAAILLTGGAFILLRRKFV